MMPIGWMLIDEGRAVVVVRESDSEDPKRKPAKEENFQGKWSDRPEE